MNALADVHFRSFSTPVPGRPDRDNETNIQIRNRIERGEGSICMLAAPVRFRASDYSPANEEWSEADPAGYVEGANLYQFVDDGPVTRTDPNGLAPAPTTRPTAVPLPDDGDIAQGTDLWEYFYNSATWGITRSNWESVGNDFKFAGTTTSRIELEPPANPKCPITEALRKAIKDFNTAAGDHEKDVQNWIEKNVPRGPISAADKKAFESKVNAQWGDNSADEIQARIDMYSKLQTAYDASLCKGQAKEGFMPIIRGLKARLARIQKGKSKQE